jgi:asparagine N-glycosylation enzyme membrane subunit Stt3
MSAVLLKPLSSIIWPHYVTICFIPLLFSLVTFVCDNTFAESPYKNANFFLL